MLNRIIASKLKTSRRLVIPNLGVFIVGSDGRILFSELMRSDDGVLRQAVTEEKGVSESEANILIDRFVFEIRAALERGTSYRIEGFGALQRDERGVVVFRNNDTRAILRDIYAQEEKAAEEAESGAKDVAPTVAAAPAPAKRAPRPAAGRKGGVDIFLITAIVVAIVAVGVIIYGYIQSKAREEAPFIDSIEQTEGGSEAENEPAAEPAAEQKKPDKKAEKEKEIVDLSIPSGK